MMRTVRFGLVVALALLIAAPILAGGGGGKGKRGGGGMFGGGVTTANIERALGRLTLSEAEKTATDKILADNKDKVAECAKKAAPTADQQAAIKEAMTKARDDGTPMNEMMKVVTAAAKWTDDQTKARTEGAALIKEITTKITEALVGDNKDLFTKALTARGGRGGGKKKAPDATT